MRTRNIWILFCTLVLQAVAQTTNTWTQTAGGARNWNDGVNWQGGLAPSPVSGDMVDFSTVNIAANTTLTLQADRTAEIWKFGDTSNGQDWTVNAGNKIVLAGTTPTINVVNRTATLNNVLDGTEGLTKAGAGTLTLGGINTFTGPIVINGGTLAPATLNTLGSGGDITFTGSATLSTAHSAYPVFAKSVTVNSGVTASLNPGSQYYKMTFTGPLSGNGTLDFNTGAGGAGSDLTFSSDSNTFTGKVVITMSGNGGGGLTVNSLADGANPIQLKGNTNPSIFKLGAGTAAPLLFNSRQIELNGTASGGGTIQNNNAAATNTITINTGLLISAAGNKTLTLGGSNTSSNTFAGTITNGASAVISLAKADGGKWIVSGANTYSGGTIVSAGTLVADAAHALGSGNVTVNGGTLVIGAADAVTSSASLYLPSATTKNLTLNADASVAKLFLAGVQQPYGTYTSSGTGTNWMNTGSGTLTVGPAEAQPVYWDLDASTEGAGGSEPASTWDAASTYWNALYDGTGSVSAWVAGRTAAFAAGTNAIGTYTVTVDGTQDIGGLTFEEGTVTLSGGTALRMVSDAMAYVATASQTTTVATAISEDATPRGLTKTGTGTLVLSGANAYTGPTTVGAGTLRLAHADAISASSGLTLGSGASAVLDTDVTLKALTFEDGNNNSTVSGGTLVFSAGGVITNKNDTSSKIQTITSAITGSPSVALASGSPAGGAEQYLQFAPTSGTVTLGTVNLAYNDGDGGDKSHIRLAGTTTGNSIAAVMQDYVYAGIRQVSGEWTFGNVTAGRIWFDGGTMIINGTFASSYFGFAQAIPSGARLGGGGGTLTLTVPNTVTGSGATLTIGGNLNLTVANEHTGGTTLNAGTLILGDAGALGSGTFTFAAAGPLQASGTVVTVNPVAANSDFTVSGTGSLTLGDMTLSANRIITLNTTAGTTTFGAISGSNRALTFSGNGDTTVTGIIATGTGALTKNGVGTLTLTGSEPSSFTGGTTVNAGSLIVVGTNALSSASSIWLLNKTLLRIQQDGDFTITNPWRAGPGRTLITTTQVDRVTSGDADGASYLFTGQNSHDTGSTVYWQAGPNITSGTPTVTLSGGMRSQDSNDGTISLYPEGLNLRINGISNTRQRIWALSGTSASNEVYGAVADSGTYPCGITKAGPGTWILSAINTYTRPTAINQGTLIGVTGGSCAKSSVTLADAATLGIRVTDIAQPWSCSNLTVSAGTAALLAFSYGQTPSTTLAPLSIIGDLTFTGVPGVEVDPTNVKMGKTIPLLTVTGTAPTEVPALTGIEGTLFWGGTGNKTLFLSTPAPGTVIHLL